MGEGRRRSTDGWTLARGAGVAAALGLMALVLGVLPVGSTTSPAGAIGSDGPSIVVSAKSNIFGAGHSSPPSPGGGGGGILPRRYPIASRANTITFRTVEGVIDNVGRNKADGVLGDIEIDSFGGISGIRHERYFFLGGVFLTDTEPTDPAPDVLDFSADGLTDSFDVLAPEIGQSFFIGDGLTGRRRGRTQQFVVPDGATRLFLGFHDGPGLDGPPGHYDDNGGALDVTINATLSELEARQGATAWGGGRFVTIEPDAACTWTAKVVGAQPRAFTVPDVGPMTTLETAGTTKIPVVGIATGERDPATKTVPIAVRCEPVFPPGTLPATRVGRPNGDPPITETVQVELDPRSPTDERRLEPGIWTGGIIGQAGGNVWMRVSRDGEIVDFQADAVQNCAKEGVSAPAGIVGTKLLSDVAPRPLRDFPKAASVFHQAAPGTTQGMMRAQLDFTFATERQGGVTLSVSKQDSDVYCMVSAASYSLRHGGDPDVRDRVEFKVP